MEWFVGVSEVIRNLGLAGAAGFGIYLAYHRVVAANTQADASLEQAELSRRDHVAELFNRAVGQLGDEKLEVRLGAIYTLRQIGNDFPDLSDPVFELLAVYLRLHKTDYSDKEPPIDIQEIMETIESRLKVKT